MNKYLLTSSELQRVRTLLDECRRAHPSAEDEDFVRDAPLVAARLPEGLLRELYRLRDLQDHAGVLVVSGFSPRTPMPATPRTWFKADSYHPDFDCDYLAILMASVFGEPFGFETQQAGKLIHDILPMKGREYAQEGANSLQMLNFHTEDTFHPMRADFICLHCVRNPDHTATLIAAARDLRLSDRDMAVLAQPRFHHLADDSHSEDVARPRAEPVLIGHAASPYIRFDLDFTVAAAGDDEAAQVLERLVRELQARSREVPLSDGDLCFIDNYKWLHGRKSFQPRFDGGDRWLRRFNVKVDLSEAMDYRGSPTSRMLRFDAVTGGRR